MARFLTVENSVHSSYIESILEILNNLQIEQTDKLYKACVNLTFGALGCSLLTFKRFNMVMYNKYSANIRKIMLLFSDVEVPCIKETQELIGWRKASDDEELY